MKIRNKTERPKERNCRYCISPNWNPSHKCPARESICVNCKKERRIAKACTSELRKQQIKEMTEPEGTEESDTDRSINIITEMKQVTYRRNHITITLKFYGTEKELIEREDTKPLLGMDWLRELNWTIQNIRNQRQPTNHRSTE